LVSLNIKSEGQIDEKGATMVLSTVQYSDWSEKNDKGFIEPKLVKLSNITVTVTNSVPVISLTDTVTISALGNEGKQTVTVSLENRYPITGLEASILLPKGLSMETKANGSINFIYANDRLVDPISIVSNAVAAKEGDEYSKVRVVVASTSGTEFAGNKGAIFSFNVIGDENLAEQASLIIQDVVITTESAVAVDLDPYTAVVVNDVLARKNVAQATYDSISPLVDSVAVKYAAALETIATYVSSAAKAYAAEDNAQSKAIADGIAATKQELADGLAASTLNNADGAWNAKVDSLQALVDTLSSNALAQAVADAQATYNDVSAQLDTVVAKYNAALETIAAYPSEAAQAIGSGEGAAAIAAGIAATGQSLNDELAAITLNNEDGAWTATIDSLQALVDTLSATAASVQAEADKAAAVQEVYDAVAALLNKVSDNYQAALAEIAAYPTDAAKAVGTGEESQAIAGGIDAIRQALAAELAAGTLSNEDGAWTEKIDALQAQVDALTEQAGKANLSAIYDGEKVSIVHYTELVDILTEKTTAPAADSKEFLKYDVNGDGAINSSDIRAMIDLIIEQNKVKK
jgi:hypothetical protein